MTTRDWIGIAILGTTFWMLIIAIVALAVELKQC